MWQMRKPLKERNYRSSPTYKKYQAYVGKLVTSKDFVGYEINPETGRQQPKYSDFLFLVISIQPHRYYRNRFAFKLSAVGEHHDREIGAADLIHKIENGKKMEYGWKVISHD